jgi:hypothetical protein
VKSFDLRSQDVEEKEKFEELKIKWVEKEN